MMLDRLRGIFWSVYLRLRGAQVGKNLRVHDSLDILLRDGASLRNVNIGDNVELGGKIYIRMRRNGQIRIGADSRLGTEVWLVTANNAQLSLGRSTRMGSYCILNAGHGIHLGDACLVAGFVYINSSNHRFDGPGLIQEQGHTGAPVVIGDDVWLGGRALINQGVTIGTGAVIGAGAVVTSDIPDYQIAVGMPARVTRDRRQDAKEIART
jgi:acetyltransferase-like isoleucine patch superfamily enzyme